jgi:cation:H+ antiporter
LIFTDIFLFLLGLFLLYIGADLLVKGSSRLALLLRISPIVVGLTVVAFGTSSPEFLVSFVAAYQGNIGVSIGNIVGSNVANIGLVLGFSAILLPIAISKEEVKSELYWMMGATVLFWIFAFDNEISRWEGAILFAGIIAFTGGVIRESLQERKNNSSDDIPHIETGWKKLDALSTKSKAIIFMIWSVAGILILAYGSNVTINAAISIANQLGINEVIIGLTMVAFGTSLPELATGIISVAKKENEILVGNVIGSNLFNILAVAGPIAMFFPIPITDKVIEQDFPTMFVISLFLLFLLLIRKRINRFSSIILFFAYLAYISWNVLSKA